MGANGRMSITTSSTKQDFLEKSCLTYSKWNTYARPRHLEAAVAPGRGIGDSPHVPRHAPSRRPHTTSQQPGSCVVTPSSESPLGASAPPLVDRGLRRGPGARPSCVSQSCTSK